MKKHDKGIQIDFRAVDAQLRSDETNDKWIDDNEKRIDEIVKWKQKTEGGVQKYMH
jgi:hypothetical protein